MARVPEITKREDVPAEKRHIFDEITKSRGRVGGPFAVMMNSPEVSGRFAHIGTYLRFESKLPEVLRELAIITTAKHWQCDVEYAGHRREAQKVGVSAAAMQVVDAVSTPDALPEDERLVVQYARELLTRHRVSEPIFRALHKRLGDQQITDLTAVIGYYSGIACVLDAFEVVPASAPS